MAQIGLNQSSSILLLNDGSVYVCGQNSAGQLGLGDTTTRQTHVQLPSFTTTKIASVWEQPPAILIMASSILEITQTHVYNDNDKCIIKCRIEYLTDITESDKYIKHRVLVGTTEIIPSQIDYSIYTDFTVEIPLSQLSTGNNQIKIEVTSQNNTGTSILSNIKRDTLYRETTERTFTKIDGGYIEAHIDRSTDKLDVSTSTSETISNTKEIPLNYVMNKITLS